MTLNLTEFSWWHVAKAHEIDKQAFNASAWSLPTFWSEKKEIMGFGGIAFNGADADIQTMVIKPEFQKKGYGKKLLDALLEKVYENKSKRVFLEVVAENKPAISLYLSRKFEQIAQRSNYYPDGSDAVIMQLDLRSK
jgi:ribosomal-protein-alanine N-acetyltransferase